MKKIATAMAALIALANLSATAEAQDRLPGGQKMERPSSPSQSVKKRSWNKGGKYSGQGAAVSNYRKHNLKAPSKGHRWVRDGNDFLLIATGTGIIASIVRGNSN